MADRFEAESMLRWLVEASEGRCIAAREDAALDQLLVHRSREAIDQSIVLLTRADQLLKRAEPRRWILLSPNPARVVERVTQHFSGSVC